MFCFFIKLCIFNKTYFFLSKQNSVNCNPNIRKFSSYTNWKICLLIPRCIKYIAHWIFVMSRTFSLYKFYCTSCMNYIWIFYVRIKQIKHFPVLQQITLPVLLVDSCAGWYEVIWLLVAGILTKGALNWFIAQHYSCILYQCWYVHIFFYTHPVLFSFSLFLSKPDFSLCASLKTFYAS